MRRNFERFAFFVFGGLFVSIGYLVGSIDPGANAQDGIARFDHIICKSLTVDDVNSETGRIVLEILENAPVLHLFHPSDEGGHVALGVLNTGAFMRMSTWDNEKRVNSDDKSHIELKFLKGIPTLQLTNLSDKGGVITLGAVEDGPIMFMSTVDRVKKRDSDNIPYYGIFMNTTPDSSGISVEGKRVVMQMRR